MNTSTIRHLTIDCRSPYSLAQFWAATLGFVDEPDNSNDPDDPEALIVDPNGRHPGLLFIAVPEPKSSKNRLHLDLVPDALREVEVDRLIALGATMVDDHRKATGRELDEIGADTSRREFSLRFVYLHLIEETARHLGHLDVLRELLDGTTGE